MLLTPSHFSRPQLSSPQLLPPSRMLYSRLWCQPLTPPTPPQPTRFYASTSCRPRPLLRSSAQIIQGCFHALLLLRFSAQIQIATDSCFHAATVEQQIMHVQPLFFAIYTARPHMILLPRHRMRLHKWARSYHAQMGPQLPRTHATQSTAYGHAILAYSATLLLRTQIPRTSFKLGTLLWDNFYALSSSATWSTHAQFIRHSMARGATRLISQTP